MRNGIRTTRATAARRMLHTRAFICPIDSEESEMSKLLRPGRRTSAVAVTALAVCLASLSVVGGISPARALPAPPCGPTINADTPNDPALSAPLDAKAAVQ